MIDDPALEIRGKLLLRKQSGSLCRPTTVRPSGNVSEAVLCGLFLVLSCGGSYSVSSATNEGEITMVVVYYVRQAYVNFLIFQSRFRSQIFFSLFELSTSFLES